MSENVERTSLDLRYQAYRLRNDAVEARLLADAPWLQPLLVRGYDIYCGFDT